MIESRFWLAAFPIAYLFLLAAAAYRLKRVSESFNTLRLTILCFIVGGPLYVTFATELKVPKLPVASSLASI